MVNPLYFIPAPTIDLKELILDTDFELKSKACNLSCLLGLSFEITIASTNYKGFS